MGLKRKGDAREVRGKGVAWPNASEQTIKLHSAGTQLIITH